MVEVANICSKHFKVLILVNISYFAYSLKTSFKNGKAEELQSLYDNLSNTTKNKTKVNQWEYKGLMYKIGTI